MTHVSTQISGNGFYLGLDESTDQVNICCYFKSHDDSALCCGYTTVGFSIHKYSVCNL